MNVIKNLFYNPLFLLILSNFLFVVSRSSSKPELNTPSIPINKILTQSPIATTTSSSSTTPASDHTSIHSDLLANETVTLASSSSSSSASISSDEVSLSSPNASSINNDLDSSAPASSHSIPSQPHSSHKDSSITKSSDLTNDRITLNSTPTETLNTNHITSSTSSSSNPSSPQEEDTSGSSPTVNQQNSSPQSKPVPNPAIVNTSHLQAPKVTTKVIRNLGNSRGDYELNELREENIGLKKVWHEARAQTDNLKHLLRTKQQMHVAALREKESLMRTRLEELQQSHEGELMSLSQALDLARQELITQNEQKQSSQQGQVLELQQAGSTIASLEVDCQALQTRIEGLLEERERLLEAQEDMRSSHTTMLTRLRKDQQDREDAASRQRELHVQALNELQSRETSLEDHHADHVHALAAVHRSLEEKTREVQRTEAEKRWIQADRTVLEEKLAACEERLSHESQTRARVQAEARAKLDGLSKRLHEAEASRTIQISKDQEHSRLVADLQRELAASRDSAGSELVNDLEAKLRLLGDRMETKQAKVEKLSLERSALRLQLEHEKSRIMILESNLQQLAETGQTRADLERGLAGRGLGLSKRNNGQGGVLAGDLESKNKLIIMFDQFGLQISFMLRRYRLARVGVVGYALLMHLLVFFMIWIPLLSSPISEDDDTRIV